MIIAPTLQIHHNFSIKVGENQHLASKTPLHIFSHMLFMASCLQTLKGPA